MTLSIVECLEDMKPSYTTGYTYLFTFTASVVGATLSVDDCAFDGSLAGNPRDIVCYQVAFDNEQLADNASVKTYIHDVMTVKTGDRYLCVTDSNGVEFGIGPITTTVVDNTEGIVISDYTGVKGFIPVMHHAETQNTGVGIMSLGGDGALTCVNMYCHTVIAKYTDSKQLFELGRLKAGTYTISCKGAAWHPIASPYCYVTDTLYPYYQSQGFLLQAYVGGVLKNVAWDINGDPLYYTTPANGQITVLGDISGADPAAFVIGKLPGYDAATGYATIAASIAGTAGQSITVNLEDRNYYIRACDTPVGDNFGFSVYDFMRTA